MRHIVKYCQRLDVDLLIVGSLLSFGVKLYSLLSPLNGVNRICLHNSVVLSGSDIAPHWANVKLGGGGDKLPQTRLQILTKIN